MISSKSSEVAKLHYKVTDKLQVFKNFENWVFSLKNGWVLFEKNPIFQKSDKVSEFAVECDRDSDISQHVTKTEFSKTRLVIRKTSWVLLKTAKSSQFDAECNRYSKFSLNVQNLGFCWNKINGVFDKILDFFKITKCSIVAVQGHWKKGFVKTFKNWFY